MTEDIRHGAKSAEKQTFATDLSDEYGVSLVNFLPRGTTQNSHYYIEKNSNCLSSLSSPRKKKVTNAASPKPRPGTPKCAHHFGHHETGWAMLPHEPYSPDIATSVFHLFGPRTDGLLGQHYYEGDEAVLNALPE